MRKALLRVRDTTFDRILRIAFEPTPSERAITNNAARLKANEPETWRRIAAEVFGLGSAKDAQLLMPQAIAVQVRRINRKVGTRWCIDEEGRHLISGKCR